MKDEDVIEMFFVYILFKKDKKRLNILKKMNSLKKGEGVPLLNFEGGPGILLLNFEGGSGVPLLNYEGGPGSRVPGPKVPSLGVLVPLLHYASDDCSCLFCYSILKETSRIHTFTITSVFPQMISTFLKAAQ